MTAETCAQTSRRLDEPVMGTAPQVSGWLLVEQPGAWGRNAPADSRLDATVAAALERSAATVEGLRVQLIRHPAGRRPDRRPAGGAPGLRTAFVCGPGRPRPWLRRLEFDDPRRLLGLDLAAVAGGTAPPGTVPHGAVHLVCTNGARDRCCAETGRPMADALAARRDDVWETTHVGGHRFAGNVVCLPDGTYYGRLDAASAPEVVAAHARGLLDLDHVRGRSWLAPAAQAAEISVRRRDGLARLDDVSVVAVEPGEGVTTVRLSVQGRDVEVSVQRLATGRARSVSCGGAPQDPGLFEVGEPTRR